MAWWVDGGSAGLEYRTTAASPAIPLLAPSCAMMAWDMSVLPLGALLVSMWLHMAAYGFLLPPPPLIRLLHLRSRGRTRGLSTQPSPSYPTKLTETCREEEARQPVSPAAFFPSSRQPASAIIPTSVLCPPSGLSSRHEWGVKAGRGWDVSRCCMV